MIRRLSNRWRLALAGAVAIHLVMALFLGMSVSSKPTPNQLASQPKSEVVQAVAINEQQILKEIERRSNLEKAKLRKEDARKKRLEQSAAKSKKLRQQEERKIAALKKKQKQERIKQQKAKQLAAKKRKAAEAKEQNRISKLKKEQAKLKVQKEREQQRISKLKKEQDRLKLQKENEQQQLEALTKQRKVEEQKRIELERRAENERLKKIEDERLAAQKAAFEKSMAQEQKRLQQEANRVQQRKLAIEKNRYVALIREKVVRNWVKPSGTNPGNSCKVLVHQIPGGEVIDVKATACSGSIAFKNSVERAVFRASPLPTPTTKALFDREIEFTFTP